MSVSRHLGWVLVLVAVVAAGCADSRALRRQADGTYERLIAAGATDSAPAAAADRGVVGPRGESAPAADRVRPVLNLVPREDPTLALAAAESSPAEKPAGAAKPAEGAKAAAPATPFTSMEGKSFAEVLKSDLRAAPAALWRGTTHSFGKPENLVGLGLALGADRIVRHKLDSQVRNEFRREEGSLDETGDFGGFVGNPFLHFGIAGAWYLGSVGTQDPKNHEFSKTMLEALTINSLATGLLKVSMNDRAPNDERYGWPSGHVSSSVCFAAVLHEYYGLPAAIPLYLLAGYSGASRLQDREHDLSDLVFGAALGWVIGHSVVKGELPQIAGFAVLPYAGPQGGGVMLTKSW